ncbi:probable dynein light chain isoform X1 [Tripterygium wilfordii]|nr:probable dynein light chain isoform X1 [Tripterygium wilfordii]
MWTKKATQKGQITCSVFKVENSVEKNNPIISGHIEQDISFSCDVVVVSYILYMHIVEEARKKERKMLEGKGLIKETDMPEKMQIQAMASASQALDLYDVFDCKSIAAHIKKEFDRKYEEGWQCVVGSHFGCFFTHSQGTFIYFALERLNFLIFKSASWPSSSS